MRRAALLLLLLLLLLGGCGESDDEATPTQTTGVTASEPTTDTGAPPPPPASDAMRPYELWFVKEGRLLPTWSEGEETDAPLGEALDLLLAGPDPDLEALNMLPEGTKLNSVDLADGVATIDMDSPVFDGSSPEASGLALGQLVWTATQFPSVERIRLLSNGKKIIVPGATEKAYARSDVWEIFLPEIVVEQPTGLEPVSSPLEVSGHANVFEANVTVRLLGADGEELANTFTTATCGTGCRGDYETTIDFDVSEEQEGTLVVSDDDADGDGKPQHEVRVPVTLLPSR